MVSKETRNSPSSNTVEQQDSWPDGWDIEWAQPPSKTPNPENQEQNSESGENNENNEQENLKNTEREIVSTLIQENITHYKDEIKEWVDNAVLVYKERMTAFFNAANTQQHAGNPLDLQERTTWLKTLRQSTFNHTTRQALHEQLKTLANQWWTDPEKIATYSPHHKILLIFFLESTGTLQDDIETYTQDNKENTEKIAEMLLTRHEFQQEITNITSKIQEKAQQEKKEVTWSNKSTIIAQMLRETPPKTYIQQQARRHYLSTNHPTIINILNRTTPPTSREELVGTRSANKLHPDDISILEQYIRRDTSILPTATVAAKKKEETAPSEWVRATSEWVRVPSEWVTTAWDDQLLETIKIRIERENSDEALSTFTHLAQEVEQIAQAERTSGTISYRENTLVLLQAVYQKIPEPLRPTDKSPQHYWYTYALRTIEEKSEWIHILYTLHNIQDASLQHAIWTKYIQEVQLDNKNNPSWAWLRIINPDKILDAMMSVETTTMNATLLRTTLQTRQPLLQDAMRDSQNANEYQALTTPLNKNEPSKSVTLTDAQRKKYQDFLKYSKTDINETIYNQKEQPARKETVDDIVGEVSPISIDRTKEKEIQQLPKGRDIFYAWLMATYSETLMERALDAWSRSDGETIARDLVEGISIANTLPVSENTKKQINALLGLAAHHVIIQQTMRVLAEQQALQPLTQEELQTQTLSAERQQTFETIQANLKNQWSPWDKLITQAHTMETIAKNAQDETSIGWLSWILWAIRNIRKWRIKKIKWPSSSLGTSPEVILAYKEWFREWKRARRRIIPLLIATGIWAGIGAWITFALMKDKFFKVWWTTERIVEKPEDKAAKFYQTILQADLHVSKVPREKDMTQAFTHNISVMGNSLKQDWLVAQAWDWVRKNIWTDLYRTQAQGELEFIYDIKNIAKDIKITHVPWKGIGEFTKITLPHLR
jgi:hypothetical protein